MANQAVPPPRRQPRPQPGRFRLTEPLGLTQPTVSHHLKVLAEMGLLNRKRHGIWVRFSLNQDALDALAALLR